MIIKYIKNVWYVSKSVLRNLQLIKAGLKNQLSKFSPKKLEKDEQIKPKIK